MPSSPAFAQLAAQIITSVPAGFVLQPDHVGNTGPSNLAKAVKDDGTAGAKEALTTEGFVRGYQRLWSGPAQAQIIVFLYQFASSGGARQDFVRGTKQFSGTPPPSIHVNKFSTALPTAQSLGIAGTGQGNSGAAAVIYFTTGVYNVQINCIGPTLPGLQARVTALAADQLSRLRR